jgi:hypothetical protein
MNVNELEEAFRDAAKAYENGDISASEYKNLLEGFEVEKIATMNAEELHKKEELNAIINAAITVVSAVA